MQNHFFTTVILPIIYQISPFLKQNNEIILRLLKDLLNSCENASDIIISFKSYRKK